jgi:hypothetical protein
MIQIPIDRLHQFDCTVVDDGGRFDPNKDRRRLKLLLERQPVYASLAPPKRARFQIIGTPQP